MKDCIFSNKYSSHLAPLNLWEWKILLFFSESFPLEELRHFRFQANFPGIPLKMVNPSRYFDDWSQ